MKSEHTQLAQAFTASRTDIHTRIAQLKEVRLGIAGEVRLATFREVQGIMRRNEATALYGVKEMPAPETEADVNRFYALLADIQALADHYEHGGEISDWTWKVTERLDDILDKYKVKEEG